MYFSLGYGNIVPRTHLGRGVFIIYALIGLPLTMITLKNTGECLSWCIFRLIQIVEKKVFGKEEPTNLKLKTLLVSQLAFIMVNLYMASAFVHYGNTTFLEGAYASFITLSTIGFGDYPVRLQYHTKKGPPDVGSGVIQSLFLPFMMFNLSIVACFLNSIVSMMESVHRIGARSEDTAHDANNQDNTQ